MTILYHLHQCRPCSVLKLENSGKDGIIPNIAFVVLCLFNDIHLWHYAVNSIIQGLFCTPLIWKILNSCKKEKDCNTLLVYTYCNTLSVPTSTLYTSTHFLYIYTLSIQLQHILSIHLHPFFVYIHLHPAHTTTPFFVYIHLHPFYTSTPILFIHTSTPFLHIYTLSAYTYSDILSIQLHPYVVFIQQIFLCPATKSGGVLCYTLRTFECLSVRPSVSGWSFVSAL